MLPVPCLPLQPNRALPDPQILPALPYPREPESAGISAEDGSDILENGSESAALNPVSGDGTDAETGEPSDREEPGVSAGQSTPS